jgi:hypothetical protein
LKPFIEMTSSNTKRFLTSPQSSKLKHMGWFILGALIVAFVYAQSFHNKADNVRVNDVVRDDSRRMGHNSEKVVFALIALAVILWLIGAI